MNAITAISLLMATLLMGFRDHILLLLFDVPRHYIDEGRLDYVGRQIFAAGLAFALVAASLLLLRYLRGELTLVGKVTPVSTSETQSHGEVELSDRLATAELQLRQVQDSIAAKVDPDVRESLQGLQESLAERFAQTLPAEVRTRIAADLAQLHDATHTRALLGEARGRLAAELAALGRRGNLNLVIGSLTTTVAVFLLYQAATTPPPAGTDYTGLLTFYVPRVTLAIFVEVFSFFFLRLYRSGLSDLKYFHSELLTLELKIAALETARHQADPQVIAKVIASIVDTDRTKQLTQGRTDGDSTSIDPKLVAGIVEAAMKLAKSESKP